MGERSVAAAAGAASPVELMTSPSRMKVESDPLADRILELTLEIIYVLTGEAIPFTSADHVTVRVSPLLSLIPNRRNRQKILEATRRITELLTEEDLDSLKGHKDPHREDIKRDNRLLPSSDSASIKRPESSRHDFYAPNSTPKSCRIPRLEMDTGYLEGHDDLYTEDLKRDTFLLPSLDVSSTINIPEGSPRLLFGPNSTQEVGKIQRLDRDPDYLKGSKELYAENIKRDKLLLPSLDVSSTIPEGRSAPNDAGKIPRRDRAEDMVFKVKVETEEIYVNDHNQSLGVDVPLEISTDGQYTGEEQPDTSLLGLESDYMDGKPLTSNPNSVSFGFHPSKFGTFLSGQMQRRDDGVEKLYTCSYCWKCFATKAQLNVHQKVHTADRPFSCSTCGKCFPCKSKLQTHERVHLIQKPFPCGECGKCFSDKTALISHERFHTGEKPFSCTICGKSFPRKSALTRHENIHTGERPFMCPECGKTFARKEGLAIHKAVHAGEKLYSCAECGKFFSYQSALIRHEKLHTGLRPYSCSECGKCFSRKSALIIHERVHTGEKPYSCPICGKCFSSQSHFIIHKRVHTEEIPFIV